MKTNTSQLLIAATVAIAMFSFAGPSAKANSCDRLVSLAHQLEAAVAKLNVELRLHYSHTSSYRHMLNDTRLLQAEAQHIDRLAHNPNPSLIHFRTDLREINKHVHHLHDLIDATEFGRYGPVRGDTRHVHSLMDYMERVVLSMELEIAQIERLRNPYAGSRSPFGHSPHHGHNSHRGHGSQPTVSRSPNLFGNIFGNQHRVTVPQRHVATPPQGGVVIQQQRRVVIPQQRRVVIPPPQQRRQTIHVDPRAIFNLFRR